MNRTKFTLVSTALALPLIATTLAGAATNLVANGDFAQGTQGWTPDGQWELLTTTAAGRLSITHKVTNAASITDVAIQCVQGIDDAYEHTFEVDMYLPAGQGRSGEVFAGVIGYPTPDCSGIGTYMASDYHLKTPGGTQHQSNTFVPDLGTKSFELRLGVNRNGPGAGESANNGFRGEFDNVSLTQQPGPQLADPPGPIVEVPDEPHAPKASIPEFPQGPFDIVIPGPLGQGPKAEPTSQPSGPSNPEPQQPQQPKSDEPTADVPATQPEAPGAVAEATPLPPSTGSGRAPASSSPLTGLAAALIAIASVAAPFAFRRSR